MNTTEEILKWDKKGIRIFPTQANSNGTFKVEIYRKRTQEELSSGNYWEFVKHTFIGTYDSRYLAELAGIKHAIELAEQYKF